MDEHLHRRIFLGHHPATALGPKGKQLRGPDPYQLAQSAVNGLVPPVVTV